MRARIATGLGVLALVLLALPGAAAAAAATDDSPYPASGFSPWDGSNPFNCQNQDVGTGVDFPDPGADPFCVEFDKTQQNLTDGGLLDFLAQEPARFGAAGQKCFYFQRDHWTGSIVQGEQPELWHWDGSYLIDRGAGVFAGSLQNFRILGQPASPADYFPIPPQYADYFQGDGLNGILVTGLPIDPSCAAKIDTPEERAQIYKSSSAGGVSAASASLSAPATVPSASRRKPKRRCHHKRHRARRACRKQHRR
jgi:hypothetical protein